MRSPEELVARFREQGLRITPQRQAVFRAIHGNHAHPSADAVHAAVLEEMPNVSLRTVYQTLNDLAEMEEILHLDLGTGSARFDPNVETRHHHLVCEGCGLVRDLHADGVAFGSFAPEDLPDGFEVTGAELVVRGRCASCA